MDTDDKPANSSTLQLRVLNRLKRGGDIAAETGSTRPGHQCWVWISVAGEWPEPSPLPPPPGKYRVSRFSIPPEFAHDKWFDKYIKDIEEYWLDKIDDAIEKARELAGGLSGFDAAFKFEDFPY